MASLLRQHISTEVSIRHFNLQEQAERTNYIFGIQRPARSGPLCGRCWNSMWGDSPYCREHGKIDAKLQKMMK